MFNTIREDIKNVFSKDPAARGTWEPALGRQVGAAALYTNAGLQSFATGQSGYRYVALTLSGSWAF